MAKVNAEKHEAYIKDRLIKRFEYWKKENGNMLLDLKSKDKQVIEEMGLTDKQDHAATLIILEASIATITRAIDEVKKINLS